MSVTLVFSNYQSASVDLFSLPAASFVAVFTYGLIRKELFCRFGTEAAARCRPATHRRHKITIVPLLTMMKLWIAALLASSAVAFAPVATHVGSKQSSSPISMASTVDRFPKDDYSNKPLYQPKSTTPVADRKVSWLERQTLPDVMIEPSYFLTWAVLALGPLIWWYHPCESVICRVKLAGGIFVDTSPIFRGYMCILYYQCTFLTQSLLISSSQLMRQTELHR